MSRATDAHNQAYARLAVARREYARLVRALATCGTRLRVAECDVTAADERYAGSLTDTGGEPPE